MKRAHVTKLTSDPKRFYLFPIKRRCKRFCFARKLHFTSKQETAVASKRTQDGPRYHIVTKQTSVKMDSAQDSAPTSYNPDGFILDMTGSSDKNFEVRKSFLCFYVTFLPVIKETNTSSER